MLAYLRSWWVSHTAPPEGHGTSRRGFLFGLGATAALLVTSPLQLFKPQLTGEQRKQAFIAEYIKTAEGRGGLADSMAQPLRRRLDYQGIGRKAFMVQELPSGALPTYTREGGSQLFR